MSNQCSVFKEKFLKHKQPSDLRLVKLYNKIFNRLLDDKKDLNYLKFAKE